MTKPKIDDLVTASRMREPGLRRSQGGIASLGWYRGEQCAQWEAVKLLRRWGFKRIAERMRKHYGLDKTGGFGGGDD